MGNRRTKKLFTIEEANRSLPLVSAIASDYVKLHHDVADRSDRLGEIAARRDHGKSDFYSDEVDVAVRKLKIDSRRLDELVAEFRQLGVRPRGYDGVVEFPAELFGRTVVLSWRLGEPEIRYWRDPEMQGGKRVPLDTAQVAEQGCGGTLGA
ncbi:MAG: DUF2203 domain-containing protein [Planctomycetales bacterium]|nr:DUF2203 domain-containing protein [Planctomycetales bacterium]